MRLNNLDKPPYYFYHVYSSNDIDNHYILI